jgi:hypothetical protein
MKTSCNIDLVKVENHRILKNKICDNIFCHHNVPSPQCIVNQNARKLASIKLVGFLYHDNSCVLVKGVCCKGCHLTTTIMWFI